MALLRRMMQMRCRPPPRVPLLLMRRGVATLQAKSDEPLDEATMLARIVKKLSQLALFQSDVELEAMITHKLAFLQTLGLERTAALGAVARHPMMLHYTTSMMDSKIDWLRKIGIGKTQLSKMIARHPSVMGMSEGALESTRKWFIEQGVEPHKVPFVLAVFPQSISLNLQENLEPKLAVLKALGLNPRQLRGVLQGSPGIMTLSVDRMQDQIEFFKTKKLTDDDIVRVVTWAPQTLSLNSKRVDEKLAMLDEFFGPEQGIAAWLRNPRILMYNTEQVRRSFEFLTRDVGCTVEHIQDNPDLLLRNVDRVLRPRFELLVANRIDPIELRTSTAWVRSTHEKFERKYGPYSSHPQDK